jgi:hypothetical protein
VRAYADPCTQVQVVGDNRGNPIHFAGPLLGVTHDIKLYRANRPPLAAGEQLLADKAYAARNEAHQLLAPEKKLPGRELTAEQKSYNVVHSWYRVTIEHVIAFIKR